MRKSLTIAVMMFVGGAVIAAVALLGWSRIGGDRSGMVTRAFAAALQTGRQAAPQHVPPMQLGMNLGNPNYWSSEWAFDDIVQSTSALWFQSPEGHWQPLTDQVPTDATGHPVNVPANTRLIIIIQQGSPHLPVGHYACRLSPGWEVRPFGDWQISGSPPAFDMTVTKPVSKLGIVLLLKATKAGIGLSEASCRPKGRGATLFNPAFIADNKPFAVLRFMDWMRTNHAPMRDWASRPTPAFFTQAGPKGVAIEHIVALANQMAIDPWINLPFDADPDYYRAMATYVRDTLSPDQRVYVELSNEVWNTQFLQAKMAVERGSAQYPGIPASQASDYYYADRVRAAMTIWAEVFAKQPRRLVRVLASQAVNPRRAEQALSHLDTWRFVDALATAPYFGINGNDLQAAPGAARVDAVFARGPQIVDEAIGYAKAAKAVASSHGLRYIAYEGGPGFMSFRPDLREDMVAVNNDPRMKDMYTLFLNRWKAEVGDLLVVFDSVSTPSVGGSFGHRTYTGQPLDEAPKARAVTEFATR